MNSSTTDRKRFFSILLILLLLASVGGPTRAQEAKHTAETEGPQSPAALIGAGNFPNGDVNKTSEAQFHLLKMVGGTRCRVNIYPGVYLVNNDWEKPNPACLDAILKAAHRYGVTPIVLFEFYADYEIKSTLKLGTYAQWFRLGKAFAERFRPNGIWGQEQDVKDWGITIYTAINEPDGGDFKAAELSAPPATPLLSKGLPTAYILWRNRSERCRVGFCRLMPSGTGRCAGLVPSWLRSGTMAHSTA